MNNQSSTIRSLPKWINRRYGFLLPVVWLSIVVVCGLFSVFYISQHDVFESSILALLPNDHRSAGEKIASERLSETASGQLVFLVADSDRLASLKGGRSFADKLLESGLFSNVTGKITVGLDENWEQFYEGHRSQLLAAENSRILAATQLDDNHPLLRATIARLYSPLASVVASQLEEDPLQLFFQWRSSVLPNVGLELKDDWLTGFDNNQYHTLVTASLSSSAFNLGYQRQVTALISEARAELQASNDLLYSGLLKHAAYGTEQARNEISTIGLGSLLGILALLIFCFRSVRVVFIGLLPVLVGCGVALSVCLLLFERVHMVTLAFGASLVGVAIDYSFHYLCAEAETADKLNTGSTLKRIFPAISIGLLSSVLAYLAQAVMPFPGLRQMAVFSVTGLIGAWVTVVLWFPFLLPLTKSISGSSGKVHLQGLVQKMSLLQSRWPSLKTPRVAFGILLLFSAGLLAATTLRVSDDVRELQTSPLEYLKEDLRVQSVLRGPSPGQYFVLSAETPEALLVLEEKLHVSLRELKQIGLIHDFQSSALFVPSEAIQLHNKSLLAQAVYSEGGLLSSLAVKLQSPALESRARVKYQQQSDEPISIDEWLKHPVSALYRHLWLGSDETGVHSLLTLSGVGGPASIKALTALEDGNAIIFVDRVGSLSSVLSENRKQLMVWILVAYALVFTGLSLRYGRDTWRVMASPLMASLGVLATFALLGIPVTLFHLLALLLVLGIGLDASIFMRESNNNAYAWLAVTMSALTSVLAFGLLAFSKTPVLHQFGLTVLIGITMVWLLVPCFSNSNIPLRNRTLSLKESG